MRKVMFWTLSVAAWCAAAALAYIGLILLILGPMIGPMGDIDFVGFSEADKHAARVEALWISLFGFVPLAVAAAILWLRRRVIRWLIAQLADEGE